MTEDSVEIEKTVLESINLPDGSNILRLPDTDGKPIYFLSYRQADKGFNPDDPSSHPLPIPDRHELLKDVARTDMLIQGDLEEKQRERIIYALEELKLPAILAVHLALNTDLDLTSLQKPDKDAVKPVSLAMRGRSGVGKSFITASLSLKENIEILSFDSVSGDSAVRYKEYIENNVPREKLNDLSVEETWKLVNEAKEVLRSEKKDPKTLRKMLDEATDQILLKPTRAELYLCDMPGMPGIYDFGTGRAHGKERNYDVVDFFAWETCESGVVSTHQLTKETMSHKLKWVKDDVIGGNMSLWHKTREAFLSAIKTTKLK